MSRYDEQRGAASFRPSHFQQERAGVVGGVHTGGFVAGGFADLSPNTSSSLHVDHVVPGGGGGGGVWGGGGTSHQSGERGAGVVSTSAYVGARHVLLPGSGRSPLCLNVCLHE